MRPAPRASRPPSTPARIARAIATGSSAREIALAHSTASQPSSIASAASRGGADAGVEHHRHAARARRISARLYGLRMPIPLPIGEPSGITAAQPDVLQAAREDRVVGRVGQDDEAVGDERLGGQQQLGRVGQQRALVADHLELDPVGLERLARELRGE